MVIVLGVTCQRPHSKISNDSLSVLKSLGMCHSKKSRNSSNLITIHTNLVAFSNFLFLLEMSVCQAILGSCFIFAMLWLTNCKRRHLEISNDLKIIIKFLRPCQRNSWEEPSYVVEKIFSF